MCCSECCTCDCCDRDDRSDNYSLKEFIDANDHPDASKLDNFLTFLTGYTDPLVRDPSWYTEERLISMFKDLMRP
jgi:hypothetical protein